jgi:hypothetical protein
MSRSTDRSIDQNPDLMSGFFFNGSRLEKVELESIRLFSRLSIDRSIDRSISPPEERGVEAGIRDRYRTRC